MVNQQGFPKISMPIATPGSNTVTQTWLQFFVTLWNRTGGAQPAPGDNSIPAGSVMQFAGTSVPSGWLRCDGSTVSRSGYSTLFSAIGVTWGSGDGSTTFTLPDLRDRFTIGAGTTYNLASTGGQVAVALTIPNLASHTHTIADPGHDHAVTDPGHIHAVTDPGHDHAVTDPGHDHAVTDPGHDHTITDPQHHHTAAAAASNGTTGADAVGATAGNTGNAATGITVDSNVTGLTVDSNTTDVTVDSNTTGLTVDSDVTGVTVDSNLTGITADNTGAGDPFSILPPYAGIYFIVKY